MNLWTIDGRESYTVITKTITMKLLDPEEGELRELKEAGISTKKRELKVDDLTFSPNPNNGKFNLSFALEEKKAVTINIYDINGNIVYSETLKDFLGTFIYNTIGCKLQVTGHQTFNM